MSIDIRPPQVDELRPRIAVIGVGGAGGNAIANMINASVEGVDFIVANTDAQALNASPAERRIQLGPDITQGLGAGSRPEVGRAAAEETMAVVEQALEGAHMCFIAAGMGGGTGTGAAPVIAKIARDRGILTVGVVTKPFTFEGSRRMRSADAGIEELQANVDTLIVIPNQNLFLVANPNTTFKEAFAMADEVLQQGVRGITDLMVMPGLINLDFADVRSVMHEMGKAMMGTGEAEGDGRALEAAEKAIANPLLDGVSMRGAKGVIISITGGEDMRLMEVDEAANHIRELVDPDANIIWGSAFNDQLQGKIRVSVVATGIDADAEAVEGNHVSRAFTFPARKPTPAPVAPAAAPAATYQPEQAAHNPAPAYEAPANHYEAQQYDAPQQSGYGQAPASQEPVAESAVPSPGFETAGYQQQEVAPPQPEAAPASRIVYDDFDGGTARTFAPQPSVTVEEDELVLEAPEPLTSPQPVQPEQAAPRVSLGGGTLFERMSNLSRGRAKDAEEDDDKIDIPRFLNRQNNQ